MNIRQLVNSMLTIEERLWPFEKRYGLKSAEFHRLVKSGRLEDLDGREDTSDLLEWLGLYELWLDCKSNTRSITVMKSCIGMTPGLTQMTLI